MKTNQINRRSFLAKSSAVLAAGAVNVLPSGSFQKNSKTKITGFRTLGRTGFKVSDIGCGPAIMNDENLLKAVLDTGVNIIDTAEFYKNGNNEILVGKGIKGFTRESLFINTKLIIAETDISDEIIVRVRKCLGRLNTDYLDGMMLWNPTSQKELKNKEFHKAFSQLKSEGRVRYCGISCHGSEYFSRGSENMEQIVCGAIDDGRFDLVLFVYNYVQHEMGDRILKACAGKNIGATLMKTDPFNGRYLELINTVKKLKESNMPVPEATNHQYNEIMEKQKKGEEYLNKNGLTDPSSKRKAAIGFVLDNPAVSSVFVSFRSFDEIEPYVTLSGITLNQEISRNMELLKKNYNYLYCRHACGICESNCPFNIPVNTIMRYHHYYLGQGREKYAMQKYNEINGPKLEKCITCSGLCESACPFGVSIKALLSVAFTDLELAKWS